MNGYPPPIRDLVKNLSRLPGIGEKSAMRMASHMLAMSEEDLEELARSIADLKRRIRLCPICCTLTEEVPCAICADPRRDRSTVCVVETPEDLMGIESSSSYHGMYHVLHGAISPLDDVGPGKLKIEHLIARLKEGTIKEVILATNPTAQGEATASYLMDRLEGLPVSVTRIGMGIPVGGDLKFSDAMTVKRAIENRRRMAP